MKIEYFKNEKFKEIAKKEKVSTLVAKAIEAHNLSLDKDLKIENPYKYKQMQNLVGYLWQAINQKKKIMVYGDYDVDGICSVAILKRMFGLLGHNIGYYLPNRYKDGYGINSEMVKEIHNKTYDILICIDNGINALDALNLANSFGIEVIILDHHELNDTIPPCKFYLHPQLSEFSDYNMCASSLAYYLSLAMLDKDDPKCAILAGIATLSDVMPLIKQNKILVKNAIKLLNKHEFSNLDLLVDESEYTENTLAMSLIPKLNSVGRILKDNRINLLINFLFETDKSKALEYAQFILQCNNKRKSISENCYENIKIDDSDKIIIIYKNDELIEGVCGIIASRLVNNYKIPAIVLAKSHDEKFYKGSARSLNSINIVEMLSKLDYLVNYGGHSKAAGLTINIEDYQQFVKDINQLISNHELIEDTQKVILVDEDELTYNSYLELQKYAPFGEANPYPIFALKNINKKNINFSKDNKHLIIKLNAHTTLLGFNLANRYQEKYNNYEAIFILDKNNLIKNTLSCKCSEIIGGI